LEGLVESMLKRIMTTIPKSCSEKVLSQTLADANSHLFADSLNPFAHPRYVIIFFCARSQQMGQLVILSGDYNDRRGIDMLDITKVLEAARTTSAVTTFLDHIKFVG